MAIVFLFVPAHSSKLKLLQHNSQLLRDIAHAPDDAGKAEPEPVVKVGDGPGRPLYDFLSVELPTKDNDEGVPGATPCVGLSMDASSEPVDGQVHMMLVVKPIDASASITKLLDAKSQEKSEFASPIADDGNIATACFQDSLSTTGWNNLQVATTDDVDIPLAVRAYGAGILEGVLTFDQISAFNRTVSALLSKDAASVGMPRAGAVERVLRTSLVAWEELTGGDAATEPKEAVAKQAWAALVQMRGMRDGYNILASEQSRPTVSMYHMMLMNMHAELPAIADVYSRSEEAKTSTSLLQTGSLTHQLSKGSTEKAIQHEDEDSMEGQRGVAWARWASHKPRGSAIVRRVGPDGTPEDMISGHVSFGNYGEMLRIMKTYKLNFGTSVSKVTMSSYPGCLSSTDDYFMTDKGFVLMSTNLWLPATGKYARPSTTNEGLPAFLRAAVATKIAAQPRGWAKLYASLTGIAGAKQWLIVDYSKFKVGQPIVEDTVFLVESLPRVTRLGDVSATLRTNGFFQAHGTPHFRQIREIFGLPNKTEGTYREHLSSALLDKASTVDTLAMARSVLSEIDPARKTKSTGITQIPITTRNDKHSSRPVPEGGIDAKLTSRCLVKDMKLQAISGPPHSEEYAAFDWASFDSDWPRFGLPVTWSFDWVNVAENGITYPVDDALGTCEVESES